jgi:Double zinc ribbon
MVCTECAFCDHVNPEGSKFCNACGGPLHLAKCPHCGAVNDKTATACYKCAVALALVRTEALALASSTADATFAAVSAGQPAMSANAAQPARSVERAHDFIGSSAATPKRHRLVSRFADALSRDAAFAFVGSHWRPVVSKTLRRPVLGAMAIALTLTALVGAGLYVYRQMPREVSQLPTASGEVIKGSGSDASASGRGVATPAVAEPDKHADQSPVTRKSEQTAESTAAVVVPMNLQTRNPGIGVEERPPELASCTEIVAALGLCASPSVQRR